MEVCKRWQHVIIVARSCSLNQLDSLIEAATSDFWAEPLRLVVVDYLGMIVPRRQTTPYEQTSEAAKELKRLAKRHQVAGTGVPGKLFHDFRRTAARDIVDAGHDAFTAMQITGHKTLAMFQRSRSLTCAEWPRPVAGTAAHRASRSTGTVAALNTDRRPDSRKRAVDLLGIYGAGIAQTR